MRVVQRNGVKRLRHALQVRECATALLHVAKRQGVPIFLVGHVTKTGDIAGAALLSMGCIVGTCRHSDLEACC